jgi:EAL domain-containing protein (putative c-di-GMP-specific phosphodiesterase class I)
LRRAVARNLARAGHIVAEARDGAEALRIVARGGIDVVLSDIVMPEMDGLAFLRAVRDRDLDLPVVLVTGAPSIASAAEAVAQGALAYLIKPVSTSELDAVVRRAAALHRISKLKRAAFELLGRAGPLNGDRARLEAAFERGLAGLWIAFQPIVSADGQRLFGYEALMRSVEPSLPDPVAVLDAAERLGRLWDLGRLVRDRTLAALRDTDQATVLFINLHPEDLLDDALYDPASPLVGMASRVVLEITERSSTRVIGDVRARVARLRALGFRIAIDDLGAGYASLTSFADLEPEIVKLDMALVRDIDRAPMKQSLVRSMAALCHDLGIMVVAEGVETVAERQCLIGLGCDYLQGYLLARPARAFPAWRWTP